MAWARGLDEDCELDDSDREPSLGSLNIGDQTKWAKGARDDREDDDEREYDPAEHGIGDTRTARWSNIPRIEAITNERDGRRCSTTHSQQGTGAPGCIIMPTELM